MFEYVGYKRKAGENMGLQPKGARAQYVLLVVVPVLDGVPKSLPLLLLEKAESGSIRL